jgi:pimeloyl-ACP methyl ester carboxylesterase
MPYVHNDGVQIHYEVDGRGEPLVIQHGFTSSIETVRLLGYSEALKSSHQVILIDARGHGLSAKPHTPESYGLQKAADDVVAVLDALNLPGAHFFGYSMGGAIGFAMAKFAPARLISLIIGAAHPFEDNLESFRNVDGKDPDAFLKALEVFLGEKIDPEIVPLVMTNDLEALSAAARPRPDMEDMLPALDIPCLLFAGTEDPRHPLVEACATKIPNAKFVSIPDLNHVTCYLNSELVLQHIRKFLTGLSDPE